MTASYRPHIPSEELAVTQEASFNHEVATPWSTTTTGSFVATDVEIRIDIPNSHAALFAWLELNVSHSVAAATFDAELDLFLNDAESAAAVFAYKYGIYVPAANARVPISLSAGYDIIGNIPSLVLPGNRLLRLYLKNNTAGTLTLRDLRILHGFVTGDDSV